MILCVAALEPNDDHFFASDDADLKKKCLCDELGSSWNILVVW
jgi:hypothetical protein